MQLRLAAIRYSRHCQPAIRCMDSFLAANGADCCSAVLDETSPSIQESAAMSASGLPLRKSARHPAHRQETRRQETRREAIARHRRLFLEPLEQRQLLTVVDPYPPSGENDTYSVTENVALSTSAPGVLGNDTDPNGDALTAIHYSGPGSGTLLFNADGSFTYTPAADFVGSDSFTYQAFDGALSSGLVTVTLNVEADNQAPSTNPDSYSVDQGTALTVSAPGLLANDSDSNGDPITAALASGPANGTVSINPDGSFTYEPNSGFYGTDSFSYVANDGEDDSVTTPVQITVNYVPPPVANPDYYTLDEDTSLWVEAGGVLGNDQRESQEATLVYGVTNGMLTLNPDGSFWYTPNANFHGEDSFTYQLAENVQATVYLTVNAVNDPPQVGDTSYWGYEDQQIIESSGALRNNASDADGLDGLEVELVGQAGNGHVEISTYGSFVYTPNANYWGLDSFTYRVFDGFEYSNPATVSLTIYSTNDPPVALDDTFSLVEDEQCFTADLLANDFDIDGDTMNVTLPYMPGLTQLSGGFIQYIPPANYSGTVTFTYQVNDWQWGMSTATVTFNILEVNDAPVASDDAFSIDEDGSLQVGSWYGPYGILGNDTDPDTGTAPTNAQIVSGPAHGALVMDIGGSFTYTPNANFHGTDQFTYQAVDGNGGTSNTATVSITVNSVNDLPIVVSESLKVAEDTSLAIDGGTLLPVSNVLANDSDLADGDTLWVSQFDFPAHGTLTLQNNGDFLYTPWANYHGPDSFTYLVSDGWSQVMGSVMIEVTPVNDAPEVVGESYTLDEDSTLTVTAALGVLANDSDIEDEPLTATIVSSPAHGALTLNADGSFEYVPAAEFSGFDSFSYLVSDGIANSNVAVVDLEIIPEPFVQVIGNVVREGEGGEITFVLSRLTDRDVIITYSSSDGTATAGSDYLPTTGVAVIPAGSLTTTATITTESDAENEENETFVIALTETINANSAPASEGVVTIIDAPTYSLSISVSDGIEGGNIEAIISRSGDLSEIAVVNFQVVGGSAMDEEDFLALEGQVTLPAGVASSEPIEILLLNDELWEPTETLEIKAWVLGSEAVAAAEIADDDSLPELTVTDPVGAEPATGAPDYLDFYVSYAAAGQLPLTVEVLLGDGIPGDPEHAAEVGQDVSSNILVFTDPASTTPIAVLSSSDSWTFSSNETPTIFRVLILQDSLAETDEFMHLELRPSITASLSPASKLLGTGTVLTSLASPANATGITASISADTDEIEEGGASATFTITLENAPEYHSGGSLRVTYDVTGIATEGRDFTLTRHYVAFALLTPANWDSSLGKYRMTTQQSFDIFGLADFVPEDGIEEFTITLVEVRASGIDGVDNGSYPIADQSKTVGIVDKNLAFSMVVDNTELVEPGPTPDPAVDTSFDLTVARITGTAAATFDIAIGGSAMFAGVAPDFRPAPGVTLIQRPRNNPSTPAIPEIDGHYFTVHIPFNVASINIPFVVKEDNTIEDAESITFTAVRRTLHPTFSVRPDSVSMTITDDGTDSIDGAFTTLYDQLNDRLTNWKNDSKFAIDDLKDATKSAIAYLHTNVAAGINGGVQSNSNVADFFAGGVELFLISRAPGYSATKAGSLKAAAITMQILGENLGPDGVVDYMARLDRADAIAENDKQRVDAQYTELHDELVGIKTQYTAAKTTSDPSDELVWYNALLAFQPKVDELQDPLQGSSGEFPTTKNIVRELIFEIAARRGCSLYRGPNHRWKSDDTWSIGWFLFNGHDFAQLLNNMEAGN